MLHRIGFLSAWPQLREVCCVVASISGQQLVGVHHTVLELLALGCVRNQHVEENARIDVGDHLPRVFSTSSSGAWSAGASGGRGTCEMGTPGGAPGGETRPSPPQTRPCLPT